jgi:hypothetical protein
MFLPALVFPAHRLASLSPRLMNSGQREHTPNSLTEG